MPTVPSYLKDCVVAFTGEFGKDRNRAQLKNWVNANGGKYEASPVNGNVTHLVCTGQQWLDNNDIVKAAKAREIHVVKFEWLEYSCQKKTKVSERRYSWAAHDAAKVKAEKKRKAEELPSMHRDAKKWLNNCVAAKEDLKSGESLRNKGASRLVLEGFLQDMGASAAAAAKKARKPRSDKGKKRGDVDTTATVSKSKVTKGKQASKAKGKTTTAAANKRASIVYDSDDAGGAVEATGEHFGDDDDVVYVAKRGGGGKAKRARTATHHMFSDVDATVSLTTRVDPSKVRPAPTTTQLRDALMLEADSQWAFPDNYHVYRSPGSGGGLDHSLILIRTDFARNRSDRCFLRLYESNTVPAGYAASARMMFWNGECETKVLVDIGASFEDAFRKFQDVFEELTFVQWQDKEMAMPPGMNARQVNGEDGTVTVVQPWIYMAVMSI